MLTRRKILRNLIALVAAMLMFPVETMTARGSDCSWQLGTGGFFSTPANWSCGAIPGAADRSLFNLAGNYQLIFTQNITNNRLRVNNDNVTLNLAGHNYQLTSTTSTALSVGGSTPFVHGQPAAFGRLTLTNGTLTDVSAEVGIATAGNGIITVSTGATWNNTGLLAVGLGTTGTLNVVNGGDVTAALGTIGYSSAGAATISGAGSTLTTTSHLDVAGGSTGALTINTGGRVTTTSASIGGAPGTNGTVTIDGNTSHWDQTGYFKVGEYGTGVLNLVNGGYVYSSGANQDSNLGDQSGSSGTVHVNTGGHWTIQSGDLNIGYIGAGTLIIDGPGFVGLSTGDVAMSSSGVSTAQVTINGNGGQLNGNNIFVGGYAGGSGGSATADVQNGGQLQSSYTGTLKIYPNGHLNLNAGGIVRAGALQIVSGGTFNWTAGDLQLVNSDLSVGPGATFGANLTVGANKTLEVSGLANDMKVGAGGSGTLTINAGADVLSTHTTVAPEANRAGTVTLDGAGSTWTSYHGFVAGGAGPGALTVSGGGDLESLGADLSEPCGVIGSLPSSNGTATVTGAGSLWHAYGVPASPTEFIVGDFGTGTLNILAGGVVTHESSDAVVAKRAGSLGGVTVSGAGSRWTTDIYNLTLGVAGTATLDVLAGGLVENLSGLTTLGQLAGAAGTVTIDGPNSRLSSFQTIIGNSSAGHVTVRNGGSLVANEIYVAATSGSTSDLTIDGPASSVVATAGFGYLIAGSAGTGSITIQNGGLAQANEVIVGDGTNAAGILSINGANTRLVALDEIDVGFFGHGTLQIDAGGAASAPFGHVGTGTGCTGAASVTGVGSTWTMSDRLEVGGGTSGLLTIGVGSAVSAANSIFVNTNGTIDLSGGSISSAVLALASGKLLGEGAASATVSNGGIVAPGHSAGTLTINGSYTQIPVGILNIELGGPSAGIQYDRLIVNGSAALAGTLDLSLINGYMPASGSSFTILTATSLTGSFSSVTISNLPPGLVSNVSYTTNSVIVSFTSPVVAGDLNCDNQLNASDVVPFILALIDPAGYQVAHPGCDINHADLNGDGAANGRDVQYFLNELLTP